jgi:energy-coupling factor transporter ATP-binding protein EcfA2
MTKKTKIFEFYGIDKPLFVMGALEGDNLNRFVDRETLLDYFAASIDMQQRCAIIGGQGSGKSSFLLKLCDMMKNSIYGEYLQFNFPLNNSEKSKLHFLFKVLRTIIYLILKNDKLLKHFDKDEINSEIERMENSIVLEKHLKSIKATESEAEGGIKGNNLFNLLIPAELKAKVSSTRMKEEQTVERKDYPLHTEDTLYYTIIKLLEKIDEPIVLFIDELDKVGRYPLESPEWDQEVIKILELSREIMVTQKIILVFALQNELHEKLTKAQVNEGDTSILGLINSFKELPGFDLEFAVEAVKANLAHAGYKGTIEDLFAGGVIEIVLSVVNGNPRLFMHYLIELAKNAFMTKQPQVSLELLKDFLLEIKKINQAKWKKLTSQFAPSALP